MSEWLPHLTRPLWLLLVPLLAVLIWHLWHRQRRSGQWQRLLPEALQAVLLTRGRSRGNRLPWLVLGLGWLLAVLVLLGPSWSRVEQPTIKRADPLVILLEVTPAMLATDTRPNRLEQAKRKVLDLLEARSEAQTAVVVFAGTAHTLVPLSDDRQTIRNLLEAVRPSIMPESGRRTDAAVSLGLSLLEQGAAGRGRLLLIGTGLDAPARSAIASQLEGQGDRLAILGVGTPEGAPVVDEKGRFLKDEQGAIVIPQLDSQGLRRFADSLDARYQRARLDDADLAALGLLTEDGEARTTGDATTLALWQDQGYWLLLPLLLVAATAARKGWLFAFALMAFAPPPANALDWQGLWLRPDQQGHRLLREHRPAEAAERFEDPRWQGMAHYHAENYAAAAEAFGKGETAVDHFNRGTALAKGGALQEALDAFDQALELDPELAEARSNRALVEQALRQRQEGEDTSTDERPGGDDPTARQGPGTAQPATPGAPARPGGTAAAPSVDDPTSEPQDSAPATATTPQAEAESERIPEAPVTEAPGTALHETSVDAQLRRIPDDPGELLKRKFLYEQRTRQEMKP